MASRRNDRLINSGFRNPLYTAVILTATWNAIYKIKWQQVKQTSVYFCFSECGKVYTKEQEGSK